MEDHTDRPFQWSVLLTETDHLHHVMTKKGPDGFIEVDGWEVVNTTRWEEIDSVYGFISQTILNLRHHVIVVDPIIQAAVQEQISELEAYLRGEKFPFEWVVTDSSCESHIFWEGATSCLTATPPVPNSLVEYADCGQVGERVLSSLDLEGVASYMKKLHASQELRVVVLCGAGMSTSAGIPDYRSKGGIFERMREEHPELAEQNLAPEVLFSIDHFRENPNDFLIRMKHMFSDLVKVQPTRAHKFLRQLEDNGMLLRVYRQNIDGLERKAKVSADKLVEVHGTLETVSGVDSKKSYPLDEFRDALFSGTWDALFEKHGEVIRPDVVLYGEALGSRFAECAESDMEACNLLLVLGTSLKVAPFNTLVGRVGLDAPRVLGNRDPVGLERKNPQGGEGTLRKGFRFDGDKAYRDVFVQGDCDAAASALADLLEWDLE